MPPQPPQQYLGLDEEEPSAASSTPSANPKGPGENPHSVAQPPSQTRNLSDCTRICAGLPPTRLTAESLAALDHATGHLPFTSNAFNFPANAAAAFPLTPNSSTFPTQAHKPQIIKHEPTNADLLTPTGGKAPTKATKPQSINYVPTKVDLLTPTSAVFPPLAGSFAPSQFTPVEAEFVTLSSPLPTTISFTFDAASSKSEEISSPPTTPTSERSGGVYFARTSTGKPQKPTARQISDGLTLLGLPPSASHTSKGKGNDFNILTAILAHSDLTLAFALALPPRDLLSLYCISKPFYYWVNMHLKTYVLRSVRRYCSDSEKIYPPIAYRSLWIRDPAQRLKRPGVSNTASSLNRDNDTGAGSTTNAGVTAISSSSISPMRVAGNEVAMVPSLRYLQMVYKRDLFVEQIMLLLALEGLRVPDKARGPIKKLWFLMDISSNAGRISVIHNRDYFTDEDLYLATTFFLKLDMRFTDPVDGQGETGMRKLLLGQRGLGALWKVLRGELLKNYEQLLDMKIRYDYEPSPQNRGLPIFGVPAGEVGKLCREGWGRGTEKLLRPDQLVMKEGLRRGLRTHQRYFDMLSWGFINPYTGRNVSPPDIVQLLRNSGYNMDMVQQNNTAQQNNGDQGQNGGAETAG